jgi:alkylhydroperoxidase family enzyme
VSRRRDHRLPLRTSADTSGKNREILTALEASGEDLPILRLVANSPTLLRPMVDLANALMRRATFPAVDREVVILHLARKLDDGYEWDEHVKLGEHAGVTVAQRAALSAGAPVTPPLFSDAQRLAVAVADELTDTRSLTDASWAAACAQWGEAAALELVFSVAFWGGMVPVVTAGLGIRDSIT